MSDRPALTPFDREKGPVATRGYVYERVAEGGPWRRYVLRRYRDGSAYWSPTVLVDERQFCMACLSSQLGLNLAEQLLGAPPRFTCLVCGVSFSFLP